MIMKGKHSNEANCQSNLAYRLSDYGFDVELEFVMPGYPGCRMDIAIFTPAGRLVGVVECKNMKSYSGCVKREKELQLEPQGIKYLEIARKEGFKMFWCGGDARVNECLKEVLSAFPWWKRLFWMFWEYV